jgi:retron-type reverse transcriptase
MVVTRFLQPILEPLFHTDSYGYRPGKSAKEALGVARQRCWRYNWVLDLDVKAFFETIDHELLTRAIKVHTTSAWVLLYIKRWLVAPAQLADGSLIERAAGTPQGGVAVRSWRTCIFTMRSIRGWYGNSRPSLSSVTLTTRFAIAKARRKQSGSRMRYSNASRPAIWSFIQQRRKSSFARMIDAGRITRKYSSTFSGSPSDLESSKVRTVRCSLGSHLRSVRKRRSSSDRRCASGGYISEAVIHRRLSQGNQPYHARLNQLLWRLLSIGLIPRI